ncbi:endolytic transglycosylase MltG [Streptomyces sp. URMC 123]|uniref:endolytic transglycosylase MltG n=1 Tax=Streptomyces sp. URMC 123 TaxID=3423403 RepID=UPI003F1D0C1C
MTEYGRGQGSQPWHPEDPLYGDQGWGGQQPANGGPGAYGGHPGQRWDDHAPHAPYADPHHPQQPAYGWDPAEGGDPHAYGMNSGDPYGGHGGHGGQQQPGPSYGGGAGGTDHYGTPEGYPPAHQPDVRQPVPHQPGAGPHHDEPRHDDGRYDDGRYDDGQYGDAHQDGSHHGGSHHDGSRHDDARHNAPHHNAPHHDDARPEDEDSERSSLFADDDREPYDTDDAAASDDGEPEPARGRGRSTRRERRTRPKRRTGLACLFVAVVLVGAVGGVGYFGYQFWQQHFGAAPDFEGQGSGEIQVEIPGGSSLTTMGEILKREGVVKSADAFVDAASAGSGKSIQPGIYTLRKEMSAAAAVKLMTDPANLNTLTIPEGTRATKIYALIDKKLELAAGTTEKTARNTDLGLPAWARGPGVQDPNEGFLFPAQYSISKGMKPEDLLRQMVRRAEKEYAKFDLEAKAKTLGLASPREALTVASLVQAEGKTKKDFEKVARVVYNRLKADNTETNGLLDFDSTYNYAKNQSTLELPKVSELRKFSHPYNTYNKKGLPPGPIGNPGAVALHAAVNPAEGNWYYFVSLSADNTVFSDTYAEHQRQVEKYNAQGSAKQ